MAYFAASCDPLEKNTKFAKSLKLDYPILSDSNKQVAEKYGILNASGFSNRVTFIIDREGKIAHIDTKVKVATHGKDLAKKLAELKFPPAKKRAEN